MIWGYDDKIIFFKKLIAENKLAQAYLLYGEPEIGKFTFAKQIAVLLETTDENFERPLVDTLIFDVPESETLGIDKILEAENFLYQKPLIGKRKTLIINNAHTLTKESQAALLKIIEEPPEKALIFFIGNDQRDLLETLLSRLEKIYFPTLSSLKIQEGLINLYHMSKEKASQIAQKSFGRMGRAINLLNKKTSASSEEDIENYLSNLIFKLYSQNLQKNYFLLKFLLEKEMLIKRYKRYNLNIKLQKKAIDLMLKKYGAI